MSGSSTIMQALLPGKSGETGSRSTSFKKNDLSFAAVFRQKIQVRQEKPALPVTLSNARERQRAIDERGADEGTVNRTKKTDKSIVKNPAKEKMKELVKKVKDTLEAMNDPEVTPDKLKELAKELQGALEEIKAVVAAADSQAPAEGTPEAVVQQSGSASIAGQVPPSDPVVKDQTDAQGEGRIPSGAVQQVPSPDHWDNRQDSKLKENPVLKEFEKVLETHSELISADPELKEALGKALAVMEAIQVMRDVKPEIQSPDKLNDLLGKLKGMVVQAPEEETAEPAALGNEAVSEASDLTGTSITAAETKPDADSADQQGEPSQDRQAYAGENSISRKAAEESVPSDAAGKGAAAVEKTEAPLVKPAVQTLQQPLQNPQAFQDTLDAIQEGVQAKTQFQSRIMEQVIETVKTNFKADDGKSEMIMKLKPESLGNVALKVSIEKGIVLAEFQVESQAVKQAMESNLQDLRSALQDKGFNVFDLNVSVRKDNQQQQHGNTGKGNKNRIARLEGAMERIEQKLMSLESTQRESTIDYLG